MQSGGYSAEKDDDQPGMTLSDLEDFVNQAKSNGQHGFYYIRVRTAGVSFHREGPYIRRLFVEKRVLSD